MILAMLMMIAPTLEDHGEHDDLDHHGNDHDDLDHDDHGALVYLI